MGPVDPELGRETGGVGFKSEQAMPILAIIPRTKDYEDAVETGRLIINEWELQKQRTPNRKRLRVDRWQEREQSG